MQSLLTCLMLAHVLVLSSQAQADRWITLENYGLPGQADRTLQFEEWDGEGNLFVAGWQGIFTLENGAFRKLPSPQDTLAMQGFKVISPDEYWVLLGYRPAPSPYQVFHVLYHYKSGQWARYDSTNSCLKGNTWRLLGVDSSGRAILDTRNFYGLGGPSLGTFRFDKDLCQEIPLGMRGTEGGANRYFRDTRGREYFALRDMSDVPMCRGLVRLNPGVEKLSDSLCVEAFEAAGDTLFLAMPGGLGILVGSTVTRITKVKGLGFPNVHAVLRDSRGHTWIATEGYDFFPSNIGLVRIKGSDTTILNKTNSGFPSLFGHRLGEDRHGNIWVGMGEGG